MSKVFKYSSVSKIFNPACTALKIPVNWPKPTPAESEETAAEDDKKTGPIFGKLSRVVDAEGEAEIHYRSILNTTLSFVEKLNLSILSKEFKDFNVTLPDKFENDLKNLVEKLREMSLVVGGFEISEEKTVVRKSYEIHILLDVYNRVFDKFEGLTVGDVTVSKKDFNTVTLHLINECFDREAMKRLNSGFKDIGNSVLATALIKDREAASSNFQISVLTGIAASFAIPVSLWVASFMGTITASLTFFSAIVVTSASLAIYFYIRFRQLESATEVMSAKLDEARKALIELIPEASSDYAKKIADFLMNAS